MVFKRPASGERGRLAEQHAEHYLSTQGLTIKARNYRCKAGEIDLIMNEGNTLVFVEVRLRSNRNFAGAAETVDWRKQQKLVRAAQHYLQRHGLTDAVACRFDVIAFDPNRIDGQVSWLRDAFSAA